MKRCRDCGQEKALDEFPPAKKHRDGRGSYCRPCMGVRSRASYRKRQAAAGSTVRERVETPPGTAFCPSCRTVKTLSEFTRSRYGITSAEVDAMVEAQGGLCALCHERAAQHVDHDHVTGRVRGVLCSCCNQALGNARNRTDILRAAIDYLERTTWQRQRVCTGVYRLTTPRPAAAPSPSSSAWQHLISSRRG